MDDVAGEGVFGADDDLVGGRVDADDVEGAVVLIHAAAEAFALADCVVDDAVVIADFAP